MVVVESDTHILRLSGLKPLAGKATVSIPESDIAGTCIKSVQYLRSDANPIVVVELAGPMTPDVKHVIKSVILAMKTFQVTDAFFPGSASKTSRPQCFIGKTIGDLQALSEEIRNLRIADGKFLMFSDGDMVRKILIERYRENWETDAFNLWRANQEIKFLGRIKDGFVPVTLKDDTVVQLDILSGQYESLATFLTGVSGISAYIGKVFGDMRAVIAGNQLVIVRQ